MEDASSEAALGSPEAVERGGERVAEVFSVPGTAVREHPLGLRPHALVRVEFGRVRRQPFDPEAPDAGAQRSGPVPLVRPSVVPEHDHRAFEMPEQMPEERRDFTLPEALQVELEIESEPPAPGAHRHRRDRRDLVALEAMSDHRGPAARRPGLSDRGQEQEPGLV